MGSAREEGTGSILVTCRQQQMGSNQRPLCPGWLTHTGSKHPGGPFLSPCSFTSPAHGTGCSAWVYTEAQEMDKPCCFQQWFCWQEQTLQRPGFVKSHFSLLHCSCTWLNDLLPVLSRRNPSSGQPSPRTDPAIKMLTLPEEAWPWNIMLINVFAWVSCVSQILTMWSVVGGELNPPESLTVWNTVGAFSTWYSSASKTAGDWGQPPGQYPRLCDLAPITTLNAKAWWASLVGNTACMLSHMDAEQVSLSLTPQGEKNGSSMLVTFLDMPYAPLPLADFNLYPFPVLNCEYSGFQWVLRSF